MWEVRSERDSAKESSTSLLYSVLCTMTHDTIPAIMWNLYSDIYCGPYEKMLLKHLLYDYERQNRPVLNETEPLVLTFGITLQQIIDVVSFASTLPSYKQHNVNSFEHFQDEKNQLLITCLWLNLVSSSFAQIYVQNFTFGAWENNASPCVSRLVVWDAAIPETSPKSENKVNNP